ncbi:hypothetical protein BDW68DRAFT_35905 [Aspergillus falconensis]
MARLHLAWHRFFRMDIHRYVIYGALQTERKRRNALKLEESRRRRMGERRLLTVNILLSYQIHYSPLSYSSFMYYK